jgi:hypothetical protein
MSSFPRLIPRPRFALAVLAAAALAPASAQAATTWHVTTAGDPGAGTSCPSAHNCSLREAIKDAVDGDRIIVPAFHIHLSSQLDINASITIVGAGAGKTILDGGGTHRVISVIGPPPSFPVSNASLTLERLGVTRGAVTRNNAAQGAGGAGIQNNSNGTLHLVGVVVKKNTFTGTGSTSEGVGGGGILSFSTVDLAASTVAQNTVSLDGAYGLDGGGGVLVLAGDLILARSRVSGNTATITEQGSPFGGNGGGGLMLGNQGGDDVIVEQSTVAGNTVHILSGTGQGDGGGGLLQTGSVSILSTGSTFSGNVADLSSDNGTGGGGAVFDAGGGSTYTNTTFANNTVLGPPAPMDQGGGAIFYALSTISSLANDTFARNNSPGLGTGASLYIAGTRVVIKNSIFYTASVAANCLQNGSSPGTLVSDGHNLYTDGADSCRLTGPGDHQARDLGLGTLGNRGGPVATIPLLPGSPAINAGDPQGCTDAFGDPLATDARGVSRPQPRHGRCDVGAYERALGVAETGSAIVSHGRATLQGTAVNPDPTRGTAFFEYGQNIGYGSVTSMRKVGAFAARLVQARLPKLKPGTYHYRLVVDDRDGRSAGQDRTFVIPKPSK